MRTAHPTSCSSSPASPPTPTAAPLRITPAYGVGVESAALLMSGQQGGEIPFNALALPIPGEDKDEDNDGENNGERQ